MMHNLLSTFTKRGVAAIFRRNIYTGTTLYDDSGEVKYEIKPLKKPECRTLKRHDNERRQLLYEFGLYVAACLPKFVQKVQIQHTDELEILVAPEGLFPVNSFLRNHHNCCFNQCSGATAIDVPSREFRFEVIYMLLSMRFNERVKVKTYTDELTPLRSQYDLWKSCNCHEREIYDFFGVIFTHHPDLRRILTDYGFDGHPMRKDFPLVGYTQVRYDDEVKKLVYEPADFAQEMRSFRLTTPWHYNNNFHEGFNCPPQPPPPPPKKC